MAASVVAHRGANVFRDGIEIANQVFRALGLQVGMFFERGIEVLYVGPVVHVMMQVHRLLIDDGLKGGVVVRQCWYFMRHDFFLQNLKDDGK